MAYTTPRPFLLALASSGRVPAHALLIAYWGTAGAALLSVPTREYLQSSGWVDDEPPMRPLSTVSVETSNPPNSPDPRAVGSVRSGSGFWAAGHRSGSGTSSSQFTAFSSGHGHSGSGSGQGDSHFRDSYGEYGISGMSDIPEDRVADADDDGDRDSQGTATGKAVMNGKSKAKKDGEVRDEVAAQDAFVAGMIYSLGQRILPGAPYTPSATPYGQVYGAGAGNLDLDRGRWKLEDCLRCGPFLDKCSSQYHYRSYSYF